MATNLLDKHLAECTAGLKEFNNFICSKRTQLRSARNIELFDLFHKQVLPTIDTVDPKLYKKEVKKLSMLYRNPKLDINEVLSGVEPEIISPKEKKVTIKVPQKKTSKLKKPEEIPIDKIKNKVDKLAKKQGMTLSDAEREETVQVLVRAMKEAIAQHENAESGTETETERSDTEPETDAK